MGAVYEAIDQHLGHRVALKQIVAQGRHIDKAFEREAKLLASLRHPALPRVTDYFVDPLGHFLVMDFIAGEDLLQLLANRRTPFPIAQVLLWADQVLDALVYLHAQQPPVIHRDIKPQNIKLAATDKIMLLDFGLAKTLDKLQVGSARSTMIGYTFDYAPLEQIQGTNTNEQTDLYLFAATFYHLLTNTLPTDALTRAAALIRQQPDPLQAAHLVNPQISFAVSTLLLQSMALNPNERPSSAMALRTALQRATNVHQPDLIVSSAGMPTLHMSSSASTASQATVPNPASMPSRNLGSNSNTLAPVSKPNPYVRYEPIKKTARAANKVIKITFSALLTGTFLTTMIEPTTPNLVLLIFVIGSVLGGVFLARRPWKDIILFAGAWFILLVFINLLSS